MSDITNQSDVKFIKSLLGTGSFLDNIIDKVQHLKNPDVAPIYLDYLEEMIQSDGEYSYTEVLQDFVEQSIPSDFVLLGIGANRIVLGYNNLAIKIWYKSNIQHLDDIYVEEHYTLEDFQFKQKVYYYDDSILITKRYQLFSDSDSAANESAQEYVGIDENLFGAYLPTIKGKMESLGMNTLDISLDNVGYDAELNIPIVLDYGFSVGDRKSYIINNVSTILYNASNKPTTVTSVTVESGNTYVFNTTSASPLKCKAYHINDDKFLVQALFLHILDTIQECDIKVTFGECISKVYEYLYELSDEGKVIYFVSYSKGCFDNFILDEAVGTFLLLKYDASEDCSVVISKINVCLKDSYNSLFNAASTVNRVLGKVVKEGKSDDYAVSVFTDIIKLRFSVVPDIIIEHFLTEYEDDDIECF